MLDAGLWVRALSSASGTDITSTTSTSTALGAYRDTTDNYNSESDEDYDPALDSSAEDGDEYDDDIDYDDELAEGGEGDEASNVLDEMVEMFVKNTGRAPTEEEMQEWIVAMKSLMVDSGATNETVAAPAEDTTNSLVGGEDAISSSAE
mmetsp:Transcript_1475/g.4108  ORF Transcript_1475/g.4108 Transcript_1475/m.4108 type:complete len:149 (-) Transcript_1475:181-627(-)